MSNAQTITLEPPESALASWLRNPGSSRFSLSAQPLHLSRAMGSPAPPFHHVTQTTGKDHVHL